MNRVFMSAILYWLIASSVHAGSDPTPLIEVPCMGSKVMVIPSIHHNGGKPFVKFVSLWGHEAPYIIVNNAYQANVFKINESSDKYFGGIELNNENIESLTIDGCYIAWEK